MNEEYEKAKEKVLISHMLEMSTIYNLKNVVRKEVMKMNEVATPTRQLRHLSISNSVETLRHTRRNLQDFYDEITGAEEPKEEQAVSLESNLNLAYVLDSTANHISDECNRMNAIIQEIRSALF